MKHLPILLFALLILPAQADGPHMRVIPLINSETHTLPPGAHWSSGEFQGTQGQEILPGVVAVRGSVDLLYMSPEQHQEYLRTLAAGSGSIPYDTLLSRLNVTQESGSYRLPRTGPYIAVLDNTPLPPGGAPGTGESRVFFYLTTPGIAGASDTFLTGLTTILMEAMLLAGIFAVAGILRMEGDPRNHDDLARGLRRGLLGIPVFGGSHALLTYALLAPIASPDRALGGSLLALAEGLFAIGAGLAYPTLRRRLPGGPAVQGVLLLTLAWMTFAVAPSLLGGVPWDTTTALFLEAELASFVLLGWLLGWRWDKPMGEKQEKRIGEGLW